MPLSDEKIDEKKTYMVKGATLARVMDAIRGLENLKVIWGAASSQPSISWGKIQSILTIPQWSGGTGGAKTILPWDLYYVKDDEAYTIGQAKLVNNILTGAGPVATGLSGIVLEEETKVWLSGTFDAVGVPTGWVVTTEDPADDFITWGATPTFYQLTAHYLLGQVLEGSKPNVPGFDFKIGPDTYHYEKLCFNALLLTRGIVNGRLVWYPTPL